MDAIVEKNRHGQQGFVKLTLEGAQTSDKQHPWPAGGAAA